MSASRSYFDELPQEIKEIIWQFVTTESKDSDMAKMALVASSWNTFFDPKLKDSFLIHFLANDNDACKKLDLKQLSESLDIFFLNKPSPHKIVDLLVALKKLESQILDIEFNAEREAKKHELKIHAQEIQTLLKNRFGLAGIIHSYAVMDLLDPTSANNNSLLPFIALEKLMQQDEEKNRETLALINLLGTHRLLTPSIAGHAIFAFSFENNELSLSTNESGQNQKFRLADLVMMHFDPATAADPNYLPRIQADLRQGADKLLLELSSASSSKKYTA